MKSPREIVSLIGAAGLRAWRALRDVGTWSPLLIGQMRRLGVDSIPIALFIAVFTGIVLALLSSTSSPAPCRPISWARWWGRR